MEKRGEKSDPSKGRENLVLGGKKTPENLLEGGAPCNTRTAVAAGQVKTGVKSIEGTN